MFPVNHRYVCRVFQTWTLPLKPYEQNGKPILTAPTLDRTLDTNPASVFSPQDTVEALPELLETVQAVLLDMLALVLANRTFRTATPIRRAALTQALNAGASL